MNLERAPNVEMPRKKIYKEIPYDWNENVAASGLQEG